MRPLMIISADCHAGGTPADYRELLEPRFRARYDEDLLQTEHLAERTAQVTGFQHPSEVGDDDEDGPLTHAWNAERRQGQLDADGIVAEVLFPQPAGRAAPPFYDVFGHPRHPDDPELAAAGCRAYNRWLADFCKRSPAPERHAGLALVGVVEDVAAAVSEIEWAKDAGLRGVLLRSQPLTGDGWHDPRYERIWATCEALEMPVHTHGGESLPVGSHPGSTSIYFTEVVWFGHRLFWFLLWSGVLERHPQLQLVLTEQFADWIPDLLYRLDAQYEGAVASMTRTELLTMKPSEYWARQCNVGASFMTRRECQRRHAIGVANILWGSDFPHGEGTWPHTHDSLHETFDGVPEPELRAMLGENAARVYGFDEQALALHADRIGPSVASFAPGGP